MRKPKAAVGGRRLDALARVRRNAVTALVQWQQELGKQLELVRTQLAALSGPAAAAPTAPRRRRRRRKAARPKAAAKKPRRARRKATRRKAARRKVARKPAAKRAARGRRRGRKQTLAQAIVQLIKDKGRPLRPVEITRMVREEKRYQSKSRNFYNAVMTNLVRSKDIKRTKDGRYTVAA